MLRTPQPQPQSPIPPWKDITTVVVAFHVPDLPSKNTASTLAAALFLQLDHTRYHSHHKICTDGSHSPSLPSTAAAIYDPQKTICKTWKLPPETDVVTAELFAINQALIYLHITYTSCQTVIYTESV